MYVSNAGFETLASFEDAKIIKSYFFRKRIGKNLMEIINLLAFQN